MIQLISDGFCEVEDSLRDDKVRREVGVELTLRYVIHPGRVKASFKQPERRAKTRTSLVRRANTSLRSLLVTVSHLALF